MKLAQELKEKYAGMTPVEIEAIEAKDSTLTAGLKTKYAGLTQEEIGESDNRSTPGTLANRIATEWWAKNPTYIEDVAEDARNGAYAVPNVVPTVNTAPRRNPLRLSAPFGQRDDRFADTYSTEYKEYLEHVKKGRGMANPTIEDFGLLKTHEGTLDGYLESGKDVFDNTIGKVPDVLKTLNAWAVNTVPGYGPITGQGTSAEYPEPVFPVMQSIQNKVTFSRYVDQQDKTLVQKLGVESLPQYHRLYSYMTEDEVDYYSYLLSKDGGETADAWLDSIMPELNRREMAPHAAWASQSPWNKAVSFVNTAGEQLVGGITGFVGDGLEYLSTGEIDPYSANNHLQNKVRAERAAVTETIPSGVGKAAYQLATSAADMAASMLAGYAVGGLLSGTGAAASPLLPASTAATANTATAVMVSNAASNTVIEAKERGLSDTQAMTLALLSAGIEMVTERFSIEQLLSNPKNAAQYVLKSAVTEGTEEGAANILNVVADVLVSRDKSYWNTAVENYVDNGMSREDAFKQVFKDHVADLNMDVLSGIVLGGVLSGGRVGYNYVANGGITNAAQKAAAAARHGLDEVIAKTEPVSNAPVVDAGNVDAENVQAMKSITADTVRGAQGVERKSVNDFSRESFANNRTGGATPNANKTTATAADVDAYAGAQGTAPTYNWTADNRNEGNNSGVVSLSEIVADVKNLFGLAVNEGKLSSRGALGEFHRKSEGIRLRTANEVTVLCHELGHWLDKTYGLSHLPSIQTAIDIFKASTPKLAAQYKGTKISGEAVAEFVRRYETDRTAAQRDYGAFYQEFVEVVGPDALRKLDAVAQKMNAYMTASAHERMKAAIHSTKEHRSMLLKSEGARRLVNRWAKMLYTRIFDEAAPIKRLTDKGYLRYYYAKKANAVAENGIIAGDRMVGFDRGRAPMRDVNGNVVTDENGQPVYEKSLAQVLAPLTDGTKSKANRKVEDDFGVYLVCRRGLELPGIRVFGDPTLDTPEAMQRDVERLEAAYPQFREVAEDLYRWQRNLLYTWGVETGLISLDTFRTLGEKYQAYVPLQRHIDPATGKSKKGSGQIINAIRGSGLDIIRPVDSIMVNVQRLVSMAHKNAVLQEVAKAAGNEGAAIYAERVAPDRIRNSVSTNALVEALAATGLDEAGQVDFINQLSEAYGDRLYEWQVSRRQSPNIITVMQNGTPSYYRVNDPELLDALVNAGPSGARTFLDVMAAINRPFKTLTTGANIVWNVTKNLAADFQTGYVNSTENNPFKYTKQYLQSVAEIVRNRESYKAYRAAGGGYSAYIGQNTKQVNSLAASLFHTSAGTVSGQLQRMVEAIEAFNNTIEAAPRFAEAKRTHEAGGDWMEAVFAGDEATTNFSRGGKWTRQIDKVLPYTNAAVQGLWKTGKQFKDHPVQTSVKMAVSSILLTALVKGINRLTGGEEEYNKLSNHTKNNYYCFHVGDGHFVKITKARQLSILQSTLERAWEAAAQEDPDAFYGFADYVVTSFNAVGNNPYISIASDIRANESFYGSAIVPANMEKLPEEEQYDGQTSYIARAIGDLFNLSPMQVDYAINQLSGIVGDVTTAIAPEGDLVGVLGGRNLTADSAYSNDALNVLYEELGELENRKNSIKNPDSGALYAYKAYDHFTNTISAINKYGKAHEDEERACRMLARDEAIAFREAFEEDEELVRLYDATKEGDIFPFRSFSTEFSYEGEKYAISPTETVQMMRDYNEAVDAAYAEILDSGAPDEQKVSSLKSAKDSIYEAVCEKYVAVSRGEGGDIDTPIVTNTAGVSDGEYATFRSEIASLEKANEPEVSGRDDVLVAKEYLESTTLDAAQRAAVWADAGHMTKSSYEKYADCGMDRAQSEQFAYAICGITSKDDEGNTVSGLKKERMCEAIDTFCDDNGLDREVKYRLYEACGYGESTVDDAPWYQKGDKSYDWFDDLW